MDVHRHGVILNVERYDACVDFYRQVFDLELLFARDEGDFRLSCFAFGSGYLMIETGGHAEPAGKDIRSCPTKLRFNVGDMQAALRRVREFGIEAEILDRDWGSTIDLHDPDGNRVGIRDDSGFIVQLRNPAAG